MPVVRDADRKSLLDIARDIARLGDDTKAGKVRPEDLGGSTFTITSLGAQGGLFATPILNFPEVAILGVHQMKEKPVVKDGQIVIGNVMLLSLSFDHRIIDGHIGAQFAQCLAQGGVFRLQSGEGGGSPGLVGFQGIEGTAQVGGPALDPGRHEQRRAPHVPGRRRAGSCAL